MSALVSCHVKGDRTYLAMLDGSGRYFLGFGKMPEYQMTDRIGFFRTCYANLEIINDERQYIYGFGAINSFFLDF